MTKYNLTVTLAEGQTEQKSLLFKGLTLLLMWTKYESSNLNSQTEEEVCVIEKSNPKAGVGQILELYLEYFSSYVHFSKLKRRT